MHRNVFSTLRQHEPTWTPMSAKSSNFSPRGAEIRSKPKLARADQQDYEPGSGCLKAGIRPGLVRAISPKIIGKSPKGANVPR
jgi:hypothetical protein